MTAFLRAAFLAFALFTIGAAPALAQQATPAPAQAQAAAPAAGGETTFTLSQLVAIGTGALGGIIVVDLLGGHGLATLAGMIGGGYVGNWIYWNPPQPAK